MKNNSLTFALVILISGIIIGGGIFITRTNILTNMFSKDEVTEEITQIQPISEDDHILGNPDADVIVIEYSDYECPFCLEFHETMNRLIDEYGQDGRLAWVYRHMPLEEIHLNSKRLALNSECISNIRGNSAFWEFSNQIFDNAPNSFLKVNSDKIISNLGINTEEVNSCIERDEIISKVEADIKDGKYLQSIDREFGTPYNIIITKTGLVQTVSGTIPYSTLRDLIEQHSFSF
jgi:protein-disulfide isomerase